jgi:hypothetical protein
VGLVADIQVQPAGGGTFMVRVSEGESESTHHVKVTESDLERLGKGYESPEAFLRACFEFLLAREPKESILSRFEVGEISRYFPEFEEKIQGSE